MCDASQQIGTSLVFVARYRAAKAACKQEREELDANKNTCDDDEPLPLFLNVLVHLVEAAVRIDSRMPGAHSDGQ